MPPQTLIPLIQKQSSNPQKTVQQSVLLIGEPPPFLLLLASASTFILSTKKPRTVRTGKEIKERKYGKAFVGGPFSLVEAKSGKPFTQENLRGQWNLVYFGFTNCPDVCPEELDKMTAVVDEIEKKYGDKVQPIFISCDPARDTDEALRKYLADFHPRMVGLTGSYDAVKAACKAYRVYFSTPPNTKPGDDYLVDHSIFFYLMDPAGNFIEAFGKSSAAHDVMHTFDEARKDWATSVQQGEV